MGIYGVLNTMDQIWDKNGRIEITRQAEWQMEPGAHEDPGASLTYLAQ